MTTEPLNPSVSPLYQGRYAENTAGIIAAITACVVAAGGTVMSYPSNTAGVIQALVDLQRALGSGTAGPGVAVRIPMTAGEAISAAKAVYLAADGLVYMATNTSGLAAANVLGLSQQSAAAGESLTVVARGPVNGLTGLTVGSDYFLTAGGALSSVAPVGSGTYLTMVGQAISATSLDVQPMSPILQT